LPTTTTIRRAKDGGIGELTQVAAIGVWSFVTTPRSGEVVLERESARRGSRRDVELGENVAHMTSHCPLADDQLGSDLPVGLARRHKSELRLPGDLLFILGGALPVLWLCWKGVRYRVAQVTLDEPEDVLFTEVTEPEPAPAGGERQA
jgi:hypothetical protein